MVVLSDNAAFAVSDPCGYQSRTSRISGKVTWVPLPAYQRCRTKLGGISALHESEKKCREIRWRLANETWQEHCIRATDVGVQCWVHLDPVVWLLVPKPFFVILRKECRGCCWHLQPHFQANVKAEVMSTMEASRLDELMMG